jgi:hypothetical protein
MPDTDQPIGALLTDLKQRGLLDSTLVIWGGEFGRTVYSQGSLADNYGRDHHPRNFCMWMAGGGIKGGVSYGESDDFSYNIATDPGPPERHQRHHPQPVRHRPRAPQLQVPGARCAAHRSRAPATDPRDHRVRESPQWRELAIGSADASLGIGNQVLEQYLVVITEPKADFPEGYTLAEFAEIASEQALATLADTEATDFSEVTVGGMNGLRREVTGSADGLGIFYLNTYLESPTYFHQVMTWTLVENKDQYRVVLETAADSFREVGSQLPE